MPANYTPEEISDFLEQFFNVVGTRQYIGARYVPMFGRQGEESIQWDNSAPYEPLTIVLYQGNSYTSRTYVPTGALLTDTRYWVETGNYSGQIEAYREEVLAFDGRITDVEEGLASEAQNRANADTALQNALSTFKTSKNYMLAIGNSWLAQNGGYGAHLESWMSTMYGQTIHCYGRSGAGWLVPYNNQLIQDAVTDAITAHQATGELCSDIFLLEMQNDHSLFSDTDNPTGYVAKIKEQVTRLKNAFPKAKFHYIIDDAKTITTTEYRNFTRCMERNFAFDFIYTLFFFDESSMLDNAHLANTLNGYGRLAQIIHRAATGGEQTYPIMQFDLVSDTAGLIDTASANKYVQFRGNALKGSIQVRFQCALKPTVASTAYAHKFRCANTYKVNTTLLHYLLGNGYGYAYVHGKSLDFAPAYLSVLGGGDLQLNLSPELKTWLSTTSDTSVLFVANIEAIGLFPA